MVKVSVNRYVLNRTAKTRNHIKTTFQKLRIKTIENLEEIFQTAGKIVKGETKHQRINGKLVKITYGKEKMAKK